MTDDKTQAALENHAAQREARAAELRGRAAKKRAEAMAANERAHQIGERFHGGQPILVGHHSEAGARRAQARLHGQMDRFLEASREADALESRARSIETSDRIESDDPDAVVLLRAKLADAETEHAALKAKIAALRKGLKGATTERDKAKAFLAAGFSVEDTTLHFDVGGRVPAYLLTNSGANIRRIKERIAALEASS